MTTAPLRRRLVATLALGLAASGLLGGCGDDDDTTATSGDAAPVTEPAETTTTEAEGAIEVSGAWARTSPVVATAGAVYLEITNGGDADDALVDAGVDPSIAARAELHETSEAAGGTGDDSPNMGGQTGGDMGAGGDAPMMQMNEVDEIAVPAGETVTLEPGGLHIMLLELAAPLEVGDEIELTLTFEQVGEVAVTAEVRDTAP